MFDDSSDVIYSLVERAYVRMQAGDVIVLCMEEGTSAPMQRLVEGLVLAGPQNLGALREIIAEVNARKSQLHNDINQILDNLDERLIQKGVSASTVKQLDILGLDPEVFLVTLRREGVIGEESQIECLQVIGDAREMLNSVLENLGLLEDVEMYLRDWLWGLIYQTARQEISEALIITTHSKWAH